MDVLEYFRRIGFCGFERPDLATLRRLHRRHVMSVPFENLSLHCPQDLPQDQDLPQNLPLALDLPRAWDKIVRGGRGGWCFENGALFLWVLAQLGYRTTTLSSRVYSLHRGDFSAFDNHLIGLVEVAEEVEEGEEVEGRVERRVEVRRFIVDVSFGVSKQMWEPLELEPGREQSQGPGVFRFRNTGELWVLEKTGRGPKVVSPGFEGSGLVRSGPVRSGPLYCFTLEPRSLEYFAEANVKLQTDPSSLFVNKSIVSLQWEGGVKALVGRVFSHMT